MSPVTLSLARFVAIAALLGSSFVAAQDPPADPSITPPPSTPAAPPAAQSTYPAVPLAKKGPFQYPAGIPYKVDTDVGLVRGEQLGYNICNSTTEGPTSLCQTSWLNSLDDFCLWGPPDTGRHVGDIEGLMVAYCSKPGHGTRLIPSGALTGVQFIKTPDYVQVVGFIDQTKINMLDGDWGGEMDPHGADLRGNPMGGIEFSSAFTGSPIQAIEWHNFIGGNRFCMKLCDPNGPNAAHFCEHVYDRIGLDYNCPTNAKDGVFESCDGENQDFPGTYTSNGQVMTYTQPPESLGAVSTISFVARTPSSSNCKTFSSAAVYTGLPSASATGASSTATGTGTGKIATSKTANGASSTGAGNGTQTGGSADPASVIGMKCSAFMAVIGFVASVALLS